MILGGQGIAFAVPANTARGVITALIRDGRVRRAVLGISAQTAPIARRIVHDYALPGDRGVLISEVQSGSPADTAGLQPGDVVIDFGLWSRDERSALRQAAAAVGATVELCYFELAPAEQRRRLDQRQADAPHSTWPMSDEGLAEWSAGFEVPTPGELDGSEPIDDPPDGFATWEEWRADRWPPSIS